MTSPVVTKCDMYCKSVEAEIRLFLSELDDVCAYCLARGQSSGVFRSGSDVDVIIEKKNANKVKELIEGRSDWSIINCIRRQYVHSYFVFSKQTNFYFQLDFEFDFDWWSMIILNSNAVLARRVYDIGSGVFFASPEDSSLMKVFRSLLWGGRIKEDCMKGGFSCNLDFIRENSSLKIDALNDESELSPSNLSRLVPLVGSIKWGLWIENVRVRGFTTTILRLVAFMCTEFRLLLSKNGLVVFIEGDEFESKTVIERLAGRVEYFRSPFKSYKVVNNFDSLPLLNRLKMMRDTTLVISKKNGKKVDVCVSAFTSKGEIWIDATCKERFECPLESFWGKLVDEVS